MKSALCFVARLGCIGSGAIYTACERCIGMGCAETAGALRHPGAAPQTHDGIPSSLSPKLGSRKALPTRIRSSGKSAKAETGLFPVIGRGSWRGSRDRLTLALDTYFRMQAMESRSHSLTEAYAKYQSPGWPIRCKPSFRRMASNRDQLRQYMQDLAAEKEQEFKIADNEAQRCRGALVQPPATSRKHPIHDRRTGRFHVQHLRRTLQRYLRVLHQGHLRESSLHPMQTL